MAQLAIAATNLLYTIKCVVRKIIQAPLLRAWRCGSRGFYPISSSSFLLHLWLYAGTHTAAILRKSFSPMARASSLGPLAAVELWNDCHPVPLISAENTRVDNLTDSAPIRPTCCDSSAFACRRIPMSGDALPFMS